MISSNAPVSKQTANPEVQQIAIGTNTQRQRENQGMHKNTLVSAVTWIRGKEKDLFEALLLDLEQHLEAAGEGEATIRSLRAAHGALQVITLLRINAVAHRFAPVTGKIAEMTKDRIPSYIACLEQVHKERERFQELIVQLGNREDDGAPWAFGRSGNLPDDLKPLIQAVAKSSGILPVDYGPREMMADCQKEEVGV